MKAKIWWSSDIRKWCGVCFCGIIQADGDTVAEVQSKLAARFDEWRAKYARQA